MMKIEFLDWSVDVHQPLLAGTEVSFKVRFKSLSDQRYAILSVGDGFKTSGHLSPDTTILHSYVLAKDISFTVNQERTFDLTIKLGRAVSYKGNSGSAQPILIASAMPEGLSSYAIARFFMGTTVAKKEQPLTIIDLGHFKVKETPVTPTAYRANGWTVGLFILVLVCMALAYFEVIAPIVTLVVFIAFLCVLIFRRITADNLGTMTFHPESVNPKIFLMKLKLDRNRGNIKSITGYYTVVEKVVDDRGTSSSTYYHTIHESPVQSRKGSETVYAFEHQCPGDEVPPSRNYGDVSITWKYNLQVETILGLSFKFNGFFGVDRELLNPGD